MIFDKVERYSDKSHASKTGGTPRKVGSVGKVSFHAHDHAWTFLRKYNGRKFSHGTRAAVAHLGIRKREVFFCNRVSLAIKALRTRAVEKGILTKGAEMGIDGDWERGRVWLKRLRKEERAITIYRRANSSSSDLVYTGELIQGWDEDCRGFVD